MPFSILGLDLSLTGTGWATGDKCGVFKPKATGHDRLTDILVEIYMLTKIIDTVVVEGPSFGSTGGSAHERAGLWWLVMHHVIHNQGIDYIVVAPNTLKKYATGKGNAGKDQVLSAAVKRFPHVEVDDNNAADALWLWAAGCELISLPVVKMPADNVKALDKVRLVAGSAYEKKAKARAHVA